MALKLDYVVRETSINMRRNVTLTLAAVVTMGVSLSLFGCAVLLGFGVNNLSSRWEKGVEIILFLNREVTDEQRSDLQHKLESNPQIEGVRYVDRDESLEEFRRLFQRNDAMLDRAKAQPDLLPTSFRVDPKTSDGRAIQSLTETLKGEPGVMRANSSIDAIRTVEKVTTTGRTIAFITSIGLLVAALLLILNAIRMAMFARRREIEVMKLVGATNWFIRVPFMLEGVVQGLLGSSLALIGVFFLDRLLKDVGGGDAFNMFTGMVASGTEVAGVMVSVVCLGVVIGAAGSGWAVSRFLRV